jgi:hypothetical protein
MDSIDWSPSGSAHDGAVRLCPGERLWLGVVLAYLSVWVGPTQAAPATNEVAVEGIALRIPSPEGFVQVPKALTNWNLFLDRTFPFNPGRRRLVSFVPQTVLPLDANRLPPLSRVIHLLVAGDTSKPQLSVAEFAEYSEKAQAGLKVQSQNPEPGARRETEASAPAVPHLPELQRLPRLHEEVVWYPVHEVSPRHFAVSSLYRFESMDTPGRGFGGSVSVAWLLANGKVLEAGVVGEPNDLAWTRTVCSDWTTAVLKANGAESPSPVASSTNSPAPVATDVNRAASTRPRGELALPSSSPAIPEK